MLRGRCFPVLLVAILSAAHAQFVAGSRRPRIVWSDEQTDTSGRLSSDGRWLTYVDWDAGDLYARELSTGEKRRITRNSAFARGERAFDGVVSPDGKRVAYTWAADGRRELRIAEWDGSSSRVVASMAGVRFSSQAWSPDGQRVLCVRQSGTDDSGEVGFVSIENGRFEPLAKLPPMIYTSLAPDGSTIAASALSPTDPTRRRIVLIDARSGAVNAPWTNNDSEDWAPVWTPDGRSLLFLSNRGGVPRLWQVALDGRKIPGAPKSIVDLPDGDNTIVGVTPEGAVYLGAEDIDGQQVFTASIDWSDGAVSGITPIQTPAFTGSRRAVFSPDAKRIAYLRKPRGNVVRPGWQTPVVRSLDGGAERAYPTALTLRDEPVWAQDGQSLLFAVNPEGNLGEGGAGVWTFRSLNLTDGSWRIVARAATPGQVRIAGVSSGAITYLLNSFPKDGALMTVDLQSGLARELHRFETVLSDAAVSPDERSVAVAYRAPQGGNRVQVLSLADNSVRDVGSIEADARGQLMWFPDGESILMSGRIGQQAGLWRISPSGGEPRRLRLDLPNISEARICGDGSLVAFTQRARRPVQVSVSDRISQT